MTTQTPSIDDQVQAFRRALIAKTPRIARAGLDRAVDAERRRLIADSPGVKALQARADERRREAEATERAKAEAFERGQAGRAAEREARDKAMARSAWARNGGNPAEFDDVWPEMHRRLVADRAIATMGQQRAELRERVHRAF